MALGGDYRDLYINKYTDQILHELQQKTSRLSGIVTVEQGMGQRVYFNKTGKATSSVRNARFEKIEFDDDTFERRFVTPSAIFGAKAIDQLDLDRYMRSPQAELVEALSMQLGRDKDAIIMAAIAGTAGRELNGSVSNVAFDTSNQQIAVNSNGLAGSTMSGNTSLHEGKILQALTNFETNYADGEEMFVIGHARQLNGLRSRVLSNPGAGFFQQSAPTVALPGIVSSLNGFCGMNYIVYNDIPQVSSNDAVYVVTRSAIREGVWRDLEIRTTPRDDLKDHPMQMTASMAIGAVRMYEEKVVRILCNPTITYA